MTILFLFLLMFFIPVSWAKALWSWLFQKCWKRSSLKAVCGVTQQKLKSFKDEHLTKINKKEVTQ